MSGRFEGRVAVVTGGAKGIGLADTTAMRDIGGAVREVTPRRAPPDSLQGTEVDGAWRVDAQGKGFLLLDTPYQEVKALRVDPKGILYVAAQSGKPSGDQPIGNETTGRPV